MIIHDLSIHIVSYLIRPYDQTITNIRFSRVGFYRVDLEPSQDTIFDMIGPVFPLKQVILYTIQWQPRFHNHQQAS